MFKRHVLFDRATFFYSISLLAKPKHPINRCYYPTSINIEHCIEVYSKKILDPMVRQCTPQYYLFRKVPIIPKSLALRGVIHVPKQNKK